MEKKKKNDDYIHTFVHIKIRPTLIKITVLVSISGHMVLAGVWNYLLLCILFSESTSADSGPLPGGVTQDLILERYKPVEVQLLLDCCSFTLTFIIGHGIIKMLLWVLPVFQTYSFIFPLWNSSPFAPWKSRR